MGLVVGGDVVGTFGVSTGGSWEGGPGEVFGEVPIGGLCEGDFGTSASNQVPGIKANGNNQVAVRVTP